MASIASRSSFPAAIALQRLISASRANFGGDLVLLGKRTAAGITMHCDPMPANQNAMPVVFEARPTLHSGGKLVDFLAKHADPNQNISGGFPIERTI